MRVYDLSVGLSVHKLRTAWDLDQDLLGKVSGSLCLTSTPIPSCHELVPVDTCNPTLMIGGTVLLWVMLLFGRLSTHHKEVYME